MRALTRAGNAAAMLALAVALLAAPAGTGRAEEDEGPATWVTCVNTRFGTTIRYPADYFTPQPPPMNNDGRSFTDPSGGGEFAVFAHFNVDGPSMKEVAAEMAANHAGDEITYRAAKGDWAVVSGYAGDRVFYERALLAKKEQVLHWFIISYPRAERAKYDPVVTEMSRSLAYGKGYDTE